MQPSFAVSKTLLALFLSATVLSGVATAAASDADDATDVAVASPSDRLSLSTDQLPSVDISTLSNIAVSAGAAALGVAGLALLVYLTLYMLGVKRCHLLGTCDALAAATAHFSGHPSPAMGAVGVSSGHYSPQMENSPYGAYAAVQQPSTATNSYEGNSFSKRSLDYVGPVLRSLAAAYEKYENWGS